MIEDDLFAEWHKHLKIVRDGIENKTILIDKELTDDDIAVSYVVGVAYNAGYKTLTAEMIWHLLKALTDVKDEDEEQTND